MACGCVFVHVRGCGRVSRRLWREGGFAFELESLDVPQHRLHRSSTSTAVPVPKHTAGLAELGWGRRISQRKSAGGCIRVCDLGRRGLACHAATHCYSCTLLWMWHASRDVWLSRCPGRWCDVGVPCAQRHSSSGSAAAHGATVPLVAKALFMSHQLYLSIESFR